MVSADPIWAHTEASPRKAWAATSPLRVVPTSAGWHRRYLSYSICISAIKG